MIPRTPPPISPPLARRRHRPLWVGLVIATALALVSGVMAPSAAGAATPQTVVSFTFDDGNANQVPAAEILNAKGMLGTFFVNSGTIGSTGYLTRDQLAFIAASGNEIGGHTVNHPYLDTLPTSEAKAQICLDRNTLLGWGYNVRNFAYPFAITNASLQSLAAACGYNSARQLGDLATRFGCGDCQHAESIPPAVPYETKALDEVDPQWLLSDFEKAVTDAESSGGGWVQFTFHNFCATGTACGDLSVRQDIFQEFVDWLKPRSGTNNTVVKTVGDVIGGSTKAAVPVAASANTGISNPGFETVTSGGVAECWQLASYGVNTPTFNLVPDRTGTGLHAGYINMEAYTDGDAKLLPSLDLGTCSPAATPGKSYALSAWYRSSGLTQFEIYLRDAAGTWAYWDASPTANPSESFTQLTYTTAPVPAGTTGISFGLNIFGTGWIAVDDFAITDTATVPVTTAAVTPATPNGTAGWYTTQPTVSLAVPASALATTTQYSFNLGTTWTTYTTPITVPAGSSTLSYRSTTATQTEATHTLPLKVDTVAPVVTPTFTASTRALSATAADTTSGVSVIQVKVGSSDWATFTPGTPGPAAATYQFRTIDKAGNVSTVVNVPVPAGATDPGTLPGQSSPSPSPSTSSPAPSPSPSTSSPAPVVKSATAITVTLPKSTLTFGKEAKAVVHLTAKTAPTDGTVSVLIDGKTVATAATTGGTATVTLGSRLGAGTHTVTAAFAGDATRNASTSAPAKLTIKKVASKIRLAVSPNRPTSKKSKIAAAVTLTTPKSTAPLSGEIAIEVTHAGLTKIHYKTLKATAHGKIAIKLPAFTGTGRYVIKARFTGPNVATATSSSARLSVKSR